MKAKHTPGPWFVGKMLDPCGAPCIVGDEDSVVSIFPSDWNGCTYIEADARLIAAAPDLLNALEVLANAVASMGMPVDAARAAIAKARGEA